MKYAIVLTLLALGLGRASISSASDGYWLVSAPEAYVAIGLLALALAYGLKQAGIPIEETARNPRWAVTNSVLLAPYRTLAIFCLGVTRRLDSEPASSLIVPGIHVGRLPTRSERGRFAGLGIDAVLSLCAEFSIPRAHESGPSDHFVPILDGSPPTARQFREALEWIEVRRAEGKTVLIHCAQGRGRSAIVAAVALCRLGFAFDLEESITRIRTVRPKARPSKGQRTAALRFLASFESEDNAKGAGLSTRPFAGNGPDRARLNDG